MAVAALMVLSSTAPVHARNDPPPEEPRAEAGIAPGANPPDSRPGEAFADPAVARLQSAAHEVQRELDGLAGEIAIAEDRLAGTEEAARAARYERAAADEAVAANQDAVDEFSRSLFTAMGRADEFRLLVTAANPEELLDGASLLGRVRSAQDVQLTGALERQRAAKAAEEAAVEQERLAASRKAELVRRNGDAVNKADAVSAELRDPIAEANAAVIEQQRRQRDRNRETADNWRAYLARLREAGVEPPPSASLRDPARLPAGMRVLKGHDGAAQAGLAQVGFEGQRLLVLPKETMSALTAAIDVLGKPYVPHDGGSGPLAYSCDGLVSAVFGEAGLPLPGSAGEQLARGRPVAPADAQPGDLAFAGPDRYGVQSVGIVLDRKTMVVADARLAGVVVADLPAEANLLGIVRPSLGKRDPVAVPHRQPGELKWRCGGVEAEPRSRDSGEAAGAWGGYPNGLIPSAALCSMGRGSHVLRCDAAQAFHAMSQAYAREFGTPLCATDSYRTFDLQVDLYRRKPALAAIPGTSNHGWGLAVDLCGGAESFGTRQYRWLWANGPAFGWVNPGWAREGGGREEPWHWEFAGPPR
ncbi:D-alanyl-D-alanine carboxypeptidase family protein [Prauserella marina]|uniref:D-alanyl-D-alanine carboxypeptidase family protein n=1 Tax=Prauserella marina TaxID=530584 RepID=UPI001FE2C45F|nr:D-alanyl-D-alanine carboxypeptidase family protein [Prauserella marina]